MIACRARNHREEKTYLEQTEDGSSEDPPQSSRAADRKANSFAISDELCKEKENMDIIISRKD